MATVNMDYFVGHHAQIVPTRLPQVNRNRGTSRSLPLPILTKSLSRRVPGLASLGFTRQVRRRWNEAKRRSR